jgi:hypothetical protein
MNRWRCVLSTTFVLTLVAPSFSAEPGKPDPQLTAKQQKYLKQFQASLAVRPVNADDAPRHLQQVQDDLKRLLSENTRPWGQATDTLANTLVAGLNGGLISVDQAVQLSKQLVKVLDQKEITYQATDQFVRSIEPIVNQTGLRGVEKMRLYNNATWILRTAPTFSPPGR